MSGMFASVALWIGLAGVGAGEHGYQAVKPQIFDSEKKVVPDIWVLEFIFRNPRYIMVDIPGKGRKLVWYMTYKVVNRSDKPRQFIPQFTLVTEKGDTYPDAILPRAEKAVLAREDPTATLYNSVTISSQPIPPTPEESLPQARYGVVFWEDVDMTAKQFTVYVTGLSNGYVTVKDPKTGEVVVRRKTLKMEFVKPGDIYNPTEKEIRFSGDPAWIYR